MKTQLIRMSVFAVVTAAAVYAQSSQVGKANIPFDFIVASHTMPAGQYTVEPSMVAPLLILKSADGQVQSVITNSIQSVNAQTVGKLVFHRYGNEYFLSEAWTPGSNSGRQLRMSGHERELAARARIAPGTTVVATAK
jgi:hypothetical protein